MKIFHGKNRTTLLHQTGGKRRLLLPLLACLALAACGAGDDASAVRSQAETTTIDQARTKQLIRAGDGAIDKLAGVVGAEKLPIVTVYKTPTCGCCKKWVVHLENAGFTVQTEDHENMSPIKQQLGVPGNLTSCHTATVGRYVVEGHVPAEDVKRLLREQPNVAGLAVPGMPLGSPGMEHPKPQNYETLAFSAQSRPVLFARHGPAVDAAHD